MTASNRPSTSRHLLCVLLLVVAVLTVFGRVAGHDFLMYDDEAHIIDNPQLNPVTFQNVARFWTRPYWGLYIPLSYTFLSSEAILARHLATQGSGWQFDPTVFHLGNLALHLAAVLLVFVILRRLCRHDAAACAGALFFALHPVQVESVAWISETRGLLCAVFSLLALWLFDRRPAGLTVPGVPNSVGPAVPAEINLPNTQQRAPNQKKPPTSQPTTFTYLLASTAFLLALLAKPAAVAVPLIAGILAIGVSRRPLRPTLWRLGPWLLAAVGWIIVTKLQQPSGRMTFVPPLWARPLIAGDALTFYIASILAPLWYVLRLVWHTLLLPWQGIEPLRAWADPHLFGPDYGRSPTWLMSQTWLYVSWLPAAAILAIASLLRNRRLWLSAAAISLVWLLPVLGLVPFDFQRISTVADRYLYLAMLGPALLLSCLLANRWTAKTVIPTAALLFLLAVLSFLQTGYWRDNQSLIEYGLRFNPTSVLAGQHRGTLLNRQGKHEEAIRAYLDVLAMHPGHEEACINLANSYVELDRLDEAEQALRDALKHNPNRAPIHHLLADVLARRAKTLEQDDPARAKSLLDKAETLCRQAIQLDPTWTLPYITLGTICSDRDRPDEAIQLYRAALHEDPNCIPAYINLGVVLESQHKPDEARLRYEQALAVNPEWPQAHYNLGNLLRKLGQLDAAEKHLRAALQYQPDYALAHVELGILLFHQAKTEEAIEHYRQALAIDPDLIPAHVNLGHALAAQNHPEQAAAAYRAALKLLPPNSKAAQEIQQLLNK